MAAPRIRRATVADVPTLVALRYELRAEFGGITEANDEFLERCSEWMTRELQGSAWQCWAAEQNQEVIGAVWVCRIPKIPNPGGAPEAHAYLSNFYVRPHARNAGIGSRLLDAAMTWCQDIGIDSVVLWPTDRSRPFYFRNGFRVPPTLIDKPITGHF